MAKIFPCTLSTELVLNRRARLVVQIGQRKHHARASVYTPDRERRIFERLVAANRGPLTADAG